MNLEDNIMKAQPDETTGEAQVKAFDALEGDLQQALEIAQAEAAKQAELHVRALADLDNVRRRAIREREELKKTGTANLIEAVLPALDSFRLGFTAADQHPEAAEVTRGFKMAYDQLFQALQSQGLSAIEPMGLPFDPHAHECIAQRPAPGVEEGFVVDVVRVGYRLGEKLLRPASVIIAQAL